MFYLVTCLGNISNLFLTNKLAGCFTEEFPIWYGKLESVTCLLHYVAEVLKVAWPLLFWCLALLLHYPCYILHSVALKGSWQVKQWHLPFTEDNISSNYSSKNTNCSAEMKLLRIYFPLGTVFWLFRVYLKILFNETLMHLVMHLESRGKCKFHCISYMVHLHFSHVHKCHCLSPEKEI